jgi:SM-20-related protein
VLEELVAELAQRRWCVLPDFLAAADWQPLASAARRAWQVGALRPAAVGQGATRALRPELRGDWIGWLDPAAHEPELAAYLARMQALRLALNRRAYLGLLEFESHFAVYPPGAGYVRHSDRFARGSRRALSTVLYLNAGWKPDDGGALRLYPTDGARVDVEPLGGSLAIFDSELEHEVLPAARERLSLAGWFSRRA